MEIIDLMPMDMFNKCINDCDILITHGGVGTILDGLKKGKKIIAFPRLSKYHEHQNDHQIEIVNSLSENNYLLALNENDDINEIYNKALQFEPKEFIENNNNFVSKLSTYLGI